MHKHTRINVKHCVSSSVSLGEQMYVDSHKGQKYWYERSDVSDMQMSHTLKFFLQDSPTISTSHIAISVTFVIATCIYCNK